MVDLALFRAGDVYLDLPFEKAKFRYEKASATSFRRFYGQPEQEIPVDSALYNDAICAGKVITREEYYRD
jgi:hypothetical protein